MMFYWNHAHIISTICVHKKLFCVKHYYWTYNSFNFEHVHIITLWYVKHYCEKNDNGNVLFEILLVCSKLL